MTIRSISPRAGRFASLATLAMATTLLTHGAAPAVAASIPSTDFRACTESLLKNASTLLKKEASALVKCSNALLACKLDEELGDGDFATCSAKAVESCGKGFDKLVKAEDSAREKLAKSCEPLADHDFHTSVGIGMRRLAAECGPIATEAEAYDCFVSRVRCAAADLAETLVPRTWEMMELSGVGDSYPLRTACLDTRTPATPAGGDPRDLGKCQSGFSKALLKGFPKVPRDAAKCVGGLLECQLHEDRRTSLPKPPGCFSTDDVSSTCAKALEKVNKDLAASSSGAAAEPCADLAAADVKAALGFTATCPLAATISDVAACAREAAQVRTFHFVDDAAPRTCQLSQISGNALFAGQPYCAPECGNFVVEDGETCDDGNRADFDACTNDCETGPTVATSHSIPSPAHPAETPDGTLANAVDPGSTLHVQFGTLTPDLNNAAYVRYRAAGAGDPEAVLVLVPGFAGGAHSLKIVAETMVARAAAEGGPVLEVWAFDRRTDQLEDDFGGILAESEDNPELALDWYFGAEMGLTLDPMLPRRAVFHDGSDIPFIANFTYNMFIRDIDAVIDAAAALPGSPTVFLGGHSLGTLFSARYAATDFDIGAPVVAGHDKVAGLVLFEGGGDSLPTGPPSSDALDTVIAKADGGLYHAIRTGAASCWDGTACPGGHADCAARPLAAGAVTNKCVQPVDAYAGGVISPEIHAVGDAVVLQARRHPDSWSIAQLDFGSGSAIDNVPGLSLLDALPNSSAEASVGFFLDDDFSPEVSFQASMGFSNNGPNTDLGFFLPGVAPNDPYRLWSDIDRTMPPAALFDHGAPAGAFDVNGVEAEVTPIGNVLTMVRTGDRNIGDWYFAASGLGVTAELLVGVGGFTGGLDSTELSVGRGRPDIENLTEGANIDIPIICFGGSNGISPTPGAFLPFAESIATCTAPSCDGSTARVVASDPVTPTYGGVAGGFEAYVSEGYAHIDVVASEDDALHNDVYAPLLAFLDRNTP
jgi:cysteine-rich repeat protein